MVDLPKDPVGAAWLVRAYELPLVSRMPVSS